MTGQSRRYVIFYNFSIVKSSSSSFFKGTDILFLYFPVSLAFCASHITYSFVHEKREVTPVPVSGT